MLYVCVDMGEFPAIASVWNQTEGWLGDSWRSGVPWDCA